MNSEFFGGEARRKESLARSRRSKDDNIKINFKETEWDGVYWICLASDRDRWRAFVNTVTNLRFPQISGQFLTS
jgi:hypothetical protein